MGATLVKREQKKKTVFWVIVGWERENCLWVWCVSNGWVFVLVLLFVFISSLYWFFDTGMFIKFIKTRLSKKQKKQKIQEP